MMPTVTNRIFHVEIVRYWNERRQQLPGFDDEIGQERGHAVSPLARRAARRPLQCPGAADQPVHGVDRRIDVAGRFVGAIRGHRFQSCRRPDSRSAYRRSPRSRPAPLPTRHRRSAAHRADYPARAGPSTPVVLRHRVGDADEALPRASNVHEGARRFGKCAGRQQQVCGFEQACRCERREGDYVALPLELGRHFAGRQDIRIGFNAVQQDHVERVVEHGTGMQAGNAARLATGQSMRQEPGKAGTCTVGTGRQGAEPGTGCVCEGCRPANPAESLVLPARLPSRISASSAWQARQRPPVRPARPAATRGHRR